MTNLGKINKMQTSIKDKVAIITGASKGIGRETAILLSNEGCNVVVNYNKSKDKAEETKSMLNKNSDSIIVKADVSKPEECKKLIEASVKKFKKIDILVNNAGINPPTNLEATTEEIFNMIMDVNVKGTYFCTKHAVPHMKEHSKIINISSIRAFRSRPNMAVYEAAKAAITSLTRSLAFELAPKKINVNAVAPGYTDTDMMKVLPSEILETLKSTVPFKRFGTPQEVAQVILFLSSPQSDYITGQTLPIDGGYLT